MSGIERGGWIMDVRRGERGEIVIQVTGTFDGRAAARLSGWLGEVPASTPLVVDFSRAYGCEDLVLAAVADRLAGRERLVLRGLGRHQERLLRYFGVVTDPLPSDLREGGDAVG